VNSLGKKTSWYLSRGRSLGKLNTTPPFPTVEAKQQREERERGGGGKTRGFRPRPKRWEGEKMEDRGRFLSQSTKEKTPAYQQAGGNPWKEERSYAESSRLARGAGECTCALNQSQDAHREARLKEIDGGELCKKKGG